MNYSAKLPRSRMLKVRGDISRCLKYGDRYQGQYVTVITVPTGVIRTKPDQKNSRCASSDYIKTKFAVLVTRRCGKAVERNRLKRIAREYFRLNQGRFAKYDAVIFSFDGKVEDEGELKKEMEQLTALVCG